VQVSVQRKVFAALAALAGSMMLLALGAGVALAINVDCTVNFAALCVGAKM
jgi:hypothetical protein